MRANLRGLLPRLLLAVCLWPALSAQADPIADPGGDTFNTGTHDITSTDVFFVGSTLHVNITFAASIAAPSAFAPNSVLGFIDLDTGAAGGTAPWGGPVTGGNNWINLFIPPNPGTPTIPGPHVSLSDAFYIDLGSELFHPGLVDIISTMTNLPVGTGSVSYVGSLLSITFSAALIGSPGSLKYGVLVGDFLSPTDRAPNGALGLSSAPVPEPGTLALAGLVIGVAALVGRRRRLAG